MNKSQKPVVNAEISNVCYWIFTKILKCDKGKKVQIFSICWYYWKLSATN